MSGLDDLVAKRLIEPVEVDELTGPEWITDARRHLQAAQAVESIDPAGAYVLAYDAARKSVAAVLLMTGHRVTSRPGSHQALALFATTLAETVSPPELVARIKDDDFAVLLPETNRATAVTTTTRLLASLAQVNVFSGGDDDAEPITASVAIACFPDDAGTPQQLLERAMADLEGAKRDRAEELRRAAAQRG